jgi:DNA processing protein
MDLGSLQLLLGRARGLSASQLRTALERSGAPHGGLQALEALIGASPAVLAGLGLKGAAGRWLHAPDLRVIETDRAWAARHAVRLIDATGEHYPAQLARMVGAPSLLYVRGDHTCLATAQLALVGTRRPSGPARDDAARFAAGLVRAGLTITSGLAAGIDTAGHEGALAAAGRTIAVLGSAVDQVYPREGRALANRIARSGALVSQFPPGTPPRRSHFPLRNRLISGLSVGTLVVEATRHSGSLVTARTAARAGRPVFAIPGSIHNPMARGCHALIRNGARLVESVEDILRELNLNQEKQSFTSDLDTGPPGRRKRLVLDKASEILLDAMGFEASSVDTLVERTGLPSQSVASTLLILELEGAVEPQAGGLYVRSPVRRHR